MTDSGLTVPTILSSTPETIAQRRQSHDMVTVVVDPWMDTDSTAVFIAFSGVSDHEKAFLPAGGYVYELEKSLEAN